MVTMSEFFQNQIFILISFANYDINYTFLMGYTTKVLEVPNLNMSGKLIWV